MVRTILIAVVCGMLTACQNAEPKIVVFNMSEDERPFELKIDAIEGEIIYVSPSVFEDTIKTISE
jgi:hypothetical protein